MCFLAEETLGALHAPHTAPPRCASLNVGTGAAHGLVLRQPWPVMSDFLIRVPNNRCNKYDLFHLLPLYDSQLLCDAVGRACSLHESDSHTHVCHTACTIKRQDVNAARGVGLVGCVRQPGSRFCIQHMQAASVCKDMIQPRCACACCYNHSPTSPLRERAGWPKGKPPARTTAGNRDAPSRTTTRGSQQLLEALTKTHFVAGTHHGLKQHVGTMLQPVRTEESSVAVASVCAIVLKRTGKEVSSDSGSKVWRLNGSACTRLKMNAVGRGTSRDAPAGMIMASTAQHWLVHVLGRYYAQCPCPPVVQVQVTLT